MVSGHRSRCLEERCAETLTSVLVAIVGQRSLQPFEEIRVVWEDNVVVVFMASVVALEIRNVWGNLRNHRLHCWR